MLPDTISTQLRTHFSLLNSNVVMTVHHDGSQRGDQLYGLVSAIVSASTRLHIIQSDAPWRGFSPAVSLSLPGEEPRVVFAGVPDGHEFTSLVLAVLHVGGHAPKFSPTTAAAVATIAEPVLLETVYSNECVVCPDVVQACSAFAAANRNITHVAIEGSAFRSLMDERKVRSVPTVFRDGSVLHQGRTDAAALSALLAPSASPPKELPVDIFDIVVVGAGPAGVSAALYATRKGLRTAVVAARIGGQVLDTLSIENLVSVAHTTGPQLARDFEERLHDNKILTITPAEVLALDTTDHIHRLTLADGRSLRTRAVVLAPGASWRTLSVPGEDEYRNKGVTFCPHCDGPLFAGKRVAVVGGRNSGVEAVLDLSGTSAHVELIEYTNRLCADAVLLDALASRRNVSVRTETTTEEVLGDGSSVSGLALRHRGTGLVEHLAVDGVFVQIGLVPTTAWLPPEVERNDRGEIVVDDRGATSLQGVFAAGDATVSPYKQIVSAFGSGASAAPAAFEYLIKTPQSV